MDPITDFCIRSSLRPFFKLEPLNLVQLKHETNWLRKVQDFVMITEFYFWQLFDAFSCYVETLLSFILDSRSSILMHGYIRKFWNRSGKTCSMNVCKNEKENVSTFQYFCKYVCFFSFFFKELVNTLVWPPVFSYPASTLFDVAICRNHCDVTLT